MSASHANACSVLIHLCTRSTYVCRVASSTICHVECVRECVVNTHLMSLPKMSLNVWYCAANMFVPKYAFIMIKILCGDFPTLFIAVIIQSESGIILPVRMLNGWCIR